jgi:hypothetical protein
MTYIRNNWRPILALTYGFICLADFVFFPVAWQAFWHVAWIAQTTRDGGMLHMSFGAILGAAAWTRGQEKIAALNNTTTPAPEEAETR